MKALQVQQLSPDFSGCGVSEVPVPEPGPGEARIAIRAAGINFPDILMTRGDYQFKPPLPFIGGMEFSGVIDKVGEGVDPARIGQAVIGGGAKTGAFAEFALADVASLRPKPAALSFSAAAAYGAAYLTAYVALVRRARLEAGEWVLVHGASGGVGLACVELAKHLGARVIAASGSEEKLQRIDALCHPDALVVAEPGFREAVKRITDGRGADIIFDPVGGDIFDESTRCIAFDGRLLVVGFTSGRIPTVSVNMPLIKGFSVVGVRAGEYGRQFPDRGRENLKAVDDLVASGALSPKLDCELPLTAWREGFERLLERKAVGKVILIP